MGTRHTARYTGKQLETQEGRQVHRWVQMQKTEKWYTCRKVDTQEDRQMDTLANSQVNRDVWVHRSTYRYTYR